MRRTLLRAVLWTALVGLSGLLIAGCYTVLVHPQVEMTGEDNSPRTCSDCHSSADYYYWHYPYQYNWYGMSPHWNRYYNNPWWYDNYWYWRDDGKGETPQAPPAHLWQPRVPPSSGSQPVSNPGTGGNGSGNPSGQSGDQGGKQKDNSSGHLFQPRVPPSNPSPDDTKKPDDSSDKKAGEQK